MIVRTLRPGAALCLSLQPPPAAIAMRVLRRWDDRFSGPDDAQAMVVAEGSPRASVVDWLGLANGVATYYQAYWWDGMQWLVPSPVGVGTPVAEVYAPRADVLDLVRERLEVGLNNLIAAGHLYYPRGALQVLSAPPQLEQVIFPVVAVQLEQSGSQEHYLGDFLGMERMPDSAWREQFGWLNHTSIQIGAWSLNPDERRRLRLAMQEIIIANLDLFGRLGVHQVDYSSGDDEDFQSYNAPLYRVTGRMTCLAPTWIETAAWPARDIIPVINPVSLS